MQAVILFHLIVAAGGCRPEQSSTKPLPPHSPTRNDNELVHPPDEGVIVPSSSFAGVAGSANKIVYVLDATGSMMSSFDALRAQVHIAIQNLQTSQSFGIVFINEHNPPALAPTLLPATLENKRKALEYVDAMAPRGGTEPLPGLEKAFALQPDLIYLFVDPSCFPDKKAILDLVVKQNLNHVTKLNIIAFEGGDPDNQKFLKELALRSGGLYRFLSEKDLNGK